ncbi:hypothetical protein [Imhoffiella purpurea]|uniref:Uncharacterized protein n=1 Tax=Imhoffiella purpurea TaxID=1249627 RepID=W9VBM7_9GAMM|nr:hypothetical protein [Imhoffiella purpurea]EXJ14366.1 hypothetical protein D779_2699 [Imhoffiella purpurea]
MADERIPEPLRAWIPWVLDPSGQGVDPRHCPLGPDGRPRICAWPGRLRLDVESSGGRFDQSWHLFADDWILLPGDADAWPVQVTDGDGHPLALIERDGRPSVKLEAGDHRLSGRFVWGEPPASLALAPDTGLVTLNTHGKPSPRPRLDKGGRLWLADSGESRSTEAEDRMRIKVFRRLDDSLPLRVLTRLELQVSGGIREERIGPVTLPEGVPIAIRGELPSRLGADGVLSLEVRPGRWVVEVTAYHAGAVESLSRRNLEAPWPAEEVWAFSAHPELRQVELEGPRPIDPRQTSIPSGWARLPLYLVGKGNRLQLVERHRGDADPAPDRLRLERELWLDFDGSGYSVRDRIQGQLNRPSRLDTDPALQLGQVRVNGTPSLITRLDPSGPAGVEVRQGQLDLVADARLQGPPERLPASGWLATLDQVDGHLRLPPGWDLLAVSGVDNDPGSWLTRWTLLDLFLVLILALGVGRLWGWGWGTLAWCALVLTWHEPGAPQLVWLNLLAAASLLRLLPADAIQKGALRLRWLVLWYRRLTLISLLIVGLPFLVSEVRSALYPQLEQGGGVGIGLHRPADAGQGNPQAFAFDAIREDAEILSESARSSIMETPAAKPAPAPEPSRPVPALDPNARIQTGQGVPDWQWNRFDLVWSGPVATSDLARLWLLTPFWNLVAALTGCLLSILLGLRLAGIRWPGRSGGAIELVLLCGALLAAAPAERALASEYPSPELLDALRTRLLAPPDCLPDCIDLSSLGVRATPDRLVLELTLDAAAAMAAPVPGGSGDWIPDQARLDGRILDRLGRDAQGRLLIPLRPGRHALALEGALPARNQIDISLPMTPRILDSDMEGWRLDGLDARGRPAGQIRLVRLSEARQTAEGSLVQGTLPPLVQIERHLSIGVDWTAETRVKRLSAPDFPIMLRLDLLPGESVQTQGQRVKDGHIQVALPPGQTETSWGSRLELRERVDLVASSEAGIAERWRLDVGPFWHLEYDGIPPVHPPRGEGRSLPTWSPLPGETLHLRITRPIGEPGPTLTIDRVEFRVEPGPRGSDAKLDLAVRSSQGGSHLIRLPEGVEPLALEIDGRSLALPSGTQGIELPLVPGAQRMHLAWRDPLPLTYGFSPRRPDLGAEAVNLDLSLSLPRDRWVLFASGPRVGPAVLFWGVLLVLAVLSWGLGRTRTTPLRTHDWLLLGVGLALSEVWVILVVAGWLFALGLRRRLDETHGVWRYNLIQVGLLVLTLLALASLVGAVQQGLLGRPEMQIAGNGSSGTFLHWYADRGGPDLPEVRVLSVPMWVYRGFMLGWALWLAFRLLDWLRWGWEGFAHPQLWRERRSVRRGAEPPLA